MNFRDALTDFHVGLLSLRKTTNAFKSVARTLQDDLVNLVLNTLKEKFPGKRFTVAGNFSLDDCLTPAWYPKIAVETIDDLRMNSWGGWYWQSYTDEYGPTNSETRKCPVDWEAFLLVVEKLSDETGVIVEIEKRDPIPSQFD